MSGKKEKAEQLRKLKEDKWGFILQKGAIWGILMFVLMGLMGQGFATINFIVWAIGGFFFGWFLWYFSVKQLEKKIAN